MPLPLISVYLQSQYFRFTDTFLGIGDILTSLHYDNKIPGGERDRKIGRPDDYSIRRCKIRKGGVKYSLAEMLKPSFNYFC